MKIRMMTLLLALLCGLTFAGSDNDISVAALFYAPAEDEDYDFGVGAECQVRFRMNNYAGFVFTAGLSNWSANDQYIYSDAIINGMQQDYFGDISGSVYMFPVGGSIVLCSQSGQSLTVCIEGGIKYVFIKSDVTLDGFLGTPPYNPGSEAMSEELEIDDGIIGLLKATLEYPLSNSTQVFAGFGYQFDLEKGDAKLFGQQTGDNELQSFLVEVGIRADI